MVSSIAHPPLHGIRKQGWQSTKVRAAVDFLHCGAAFDLCGSIHIIELVAHDPAFLFLCRCTDSHQTLTFSYVARRGRGSAIANTVPKENVRRRGSDASRAPVNTITNLRHLQLTLLQPPIPVGAPQLRLGASGVPLALQPPDYLSGARCCTRHINNKAAGLENHGQWETLFPVMSAGSCRDPSATCQ